MDEFEEILNLPPKSYKDYPNDEKWLTFIYNLYKKYIHAVITRLFGMLMDASSKGIESLFNLALSLAISAIFQAS